MAQKTLSAREKQIVILTCEWCLTIEEIAQQVKLHAQTVKKYRLQIYDKLGIWNINELCRYYWNNKSQFENKNAE